MVTVSSVVSPLYVEKSKKKEERAVSVNQKLTRCLACL